MEAEEAPSVETVGFSCSVPERFLRPPTALSPNMAQLEQLTADLYRARIIIQELLKRLKKKVS